MWVVLIIEMLYLVIGSTIKMSFTRQQYIEKNEKLKKRSLENTQYFGTKSINRALILSFFISGIKAIIDFVIIFYLVYVVDSMFLLILTSMYAVYSSYKLLDGGVDCYKYGIEQAFELQLNKHRVIYQYIPLLYAIIFSIVSIAWIFR